MKHFLLAGLVSLGLVSSAQAGMINVSFSGVIDNSTNLAEPLVGIGDSYSFDISFDVTPPGSLSNVSGTGTVNGASVSLNGVAFQDGFNSNYGLHISLGLVPVGGGAGQWNLTGLGLYFDTPNPWSNFYEIITDPDAEITLSQVIATRATIQGPSTTTEFDYNTDEGPASQLITVGAVPEPSSIVLLGIGGLALVGYGWRRKRQQAA